MNKEKLQQQIQTMESELAKMKVELEQSEKVKLIGGKGYYIDEINPCYNFNSAGKSVENGLFRATKELAEIASKNMIQRNKLEAYAMQIDPEWRDVGTGRTTAHFIQKGEEYEVSWDFNVRVLGTVYMSKPTAETLCEWLNDGRIEL